MDKLLRVTAKYFVAGAIFRKQDSSWICTKTAPILYWMKKIPIESVPKELKKRGCTWEWL